MIEKSEFNNLFGSFVSHKRKEKSWSQSKLAAALGNNAQNISRIERGELSPTLYWVTKLSTVFELELNEFIDEFVDYRRNRY